MKKTYFLLFVIMFSLLSGCKKERYEVPPPVDPCANVTKTSAEFMIEEVIDPGYLWEKSTPTDTIFKNRYARFTVLDSTLKDEECTWRIGAETIQSKSVIRYFAEEWANYNIPITLEVNKEPNNHCFPDDKGTDTVTKTMHVSKYVLVDGEEVDAGPIEGVYRVFSEHLPDSFEITFDIKTSAGYSWFNISNYDGQGSNCISQARISGLHYRRVWTEDGTGELQCDHIMGFIHRPLVGGGVVMEFTFGASQYQPDNPKYYKRIYLGRKLK